MDLQGAERLAKDMAVRDFERRVPRSQEEFIALESQITDPNLRLSDAQQRNLGEDLAQNVLRPLIIELSPQELATEGLGRATDLIRVYGKRVGIDPDTGKFLESAGSFS